MAGLSQRRVREAEPAGGCFVNVNTPDELAAAEARCKQADCDDCDVCENRLTCHSADTDYVRQPGGKHALDQ